MEHEERLSSLNKVKELFPNMEPDVIAAVFDEMKSVENTIDHLLLLNTTQVKKMNCNSKSDKREFSKSNWNQALIDLPDNFLRLSNDDENDEFALMLQNEEFLNELRFNKDFLMMLGTEGKFQDDSLEERLKNMGKSGRKKFLQLAKLFSFQRNKSKNRKEQAPLM